MFNNINARISYHDDLCNQGPLFLREISSGWVVGRCWQNNNTSLRSPLQILHKLLQTNAALLVIPIIILTDIFYPSCLKDAGQWICTEDQEQTLY